jgi:predicted DNA repair protein MutK
VLDVVEQAPQLESAWVLVAWPLLTALVYGVLAAWNAMDDLGRRLG